MTRAEAPAKTILFGEHAVVYGRPAIAIPISTLRAVAVVEPASKGTPGQIEIESVQTGIHGWLHEAASDDPIALILRKTLETFKHTPSEPLHIRIDSSIPIAAGLGSGAAVSIAIARALARYLGVEPTADTLSALAYEVEILHHGSPSGIDNTVIAYEQPVYFVRDEKLETFTLPQPLKLILAHSGRSVPTTAAVTRVRALWEEDTPRVEAMFDEIAHITESAYHCLKTSTLGDLGDLMNSNHAVLRRLGVSTPELDHLASAAMEAGAAGAKLSGAGLGGYLIALVDDEAAQVVYDRMGEAGATMLFAVETGS